MYVLNDICYAGEMKEGIKVTEAKPLRGGMMLVTFSTGEKRLFFFMERISQHRSKRQVYDALLQKSGNR